MAGVAGNAATLAIGKQSGKGTPQTTPAYKLKFTGGDIAPARQIIQLAETDASRQAGASVVVGSSVTGTTNHYVRPTDFGMLAYAVMGANADSGATNFTHTATSSASAPYFTLYKAINSTSLVDQYVDCRAVSLNVSGSAGGALTCAVGWLGLSAVLGATDPVLAAVTESPLVYPQVTVSKGGSDPGTVDSFSIDINQNATMLPGDSGLSNYDIQFGQFAVSGTMSLLFQNDQDYRAFNTGSTSGTALSSTIFAEALTLTATVNANLSVSFVMTQVEYTSYPVGLDVSGAPIRVSMGFRAKPQTTIANTLSIVTKNQTASY